MANGQGGSRDLSGKPMVVSGPGALSQRSDAGQPQRYVSGLPWGEGQEMMDLQSSAKMAQTLNAPTPMPSSSSATSAAPSPLTPLNAPGDPQDILTAGNPMGAGPGPEVLPKPMVDDKARLRQVLPILLRLADDPSTSDATRSMIRYLRGTL